VVKGVNAASHGLVIMIDAAPTGPLALLKIERACDAARDLVNVEVNSDTAFLIDPNGDASMGSNRSIISSNTTWFRSGR
jgi:hypothetical protein